MTRVGLDETNLRLILRGPMPWIAEAACIGVDPELFYPNRGEHTAEAKAVCAGCGVCAQCLDYALKNHETDGIWGGMSERQRRRMRRDLRQVQGDACTD